MLYTHDTTPDGRAGQLLSGNSKAEMKWEPGLLVFILRRAEKSIALVATYHIAELGREPRTLANSSLRAVGRFSSHSLLPPVLTAFGLPSGVWVPRQFWYWTSVLVPPSELTHMPQLGAQYPY
jgi:hypothetical protein